MSNQDSDPLRYRFFAIDMKFKQLEQQQLSSYLQLLVLSMEALFIGFGIGLLLISGSLLVTDGWVEAVAAAQNLTQVAVGAAILLTLFLRGVWTVLSYPTREKRIRPGEGVEAELSSEGEQVCEENQEDNDSNP